jgi:hypothetical protein
MSPNYGYNNSRVFPFKNRHIWAGVAHVCDLVTQEEEVGGSWSEASLGWSTTYLKDTKNKRLRGVVQVAECLPSEHEVLTSNPSTTKQTPKQNQAYISE